MNRSQPAKAPQVAGRGAAGVPPAPAAARGHMPFPGHRTLAQVFAAEGWG